MTWQIANKDGNGISLKAFSYEHLIPTIENRYNFNLTYSSAPFELVLYGYKDISTYILGLFNGQKGRTELATMNFEMTEINEDSGLNYWESNPEKTEVRRLKTVLIEDEEKYKYFRIDVKNNHGFKHTCLYRFYFWE